MNQTTLKASISVGFWALGSIAQAQHINSVAPDRFYDDTILSSMDYGLVCPSGTAKKLPAPDTHLGFITQRDQNQSIEHTTQIVPLAKGVGFGVDVQLPEGTNLRDVEITVFHPPYIGTDVTEELWRTDLVPRTSNLNFFLFEFPFEMVAGDWALQASHEGKLLYAVTFKVVDPSRIRNLSSYCSGLLLS
ncbi:DUF3859 domain-containing protein [Litoreibacter janthinus]|uniref:DUF3859 domain-containing protein n=1 Tax=Litoreibacter janthinus TaxID=670154 RepID=A0A1I6FPM3_9RHOB|nr:DUF3859 domain-containing protein [Litoreibacter janthinus]SFR31876.1 protein of unknown function [Litoreibacter janthinus]